MSSSTQQFDGHTQNSGQQNLPTLIAWLSVCLLAGGTGPQLDAHLQNVWIIFGLFGLTAALGLNAVNRAVRYHRRRKQRRVVQRRLDLELGRTAAGDVDLEEVRNVLRRFTSRDDQDPPPAGEYRLERRLPFQRPVRISPISSDDVDLDGSSEKRSNGWLRGVSPDGDNSGHLDTEITGWIRDISAEGVGLRHAEPLPKGPVKLSLELEKGECVALLVDVRWCARQFSGCYYSGGLLRRVLTSPESTRPVPDQEEAETSDADSPPPVAAEAATD